MKTYLALIATALTLSACGGSESAPASNTQTTPSTTVSAPAASSAPVAALSADALPAECKVDVVSDDAMKFDTKEISIKSSCTDFAITLKHIGKMPKAAMGHNIVITAAADKAAVVADGVEAKLDNDYLKPNDSRVIAATKLIGGGESDTVVFKADKLKNGEFEFFCSFPGHSSIMSGKIKWLD